MEVSLSSQQIAPSVTISYSPGSHIGKITAAVKQKSKKPTDLLGQLAFFYEI
jgi:hypothetical protein